MVKACFLDRDGVIVEEVNYLSSPDDVRLIPQAPEALRRLRDAGFLCVVVTNQAGVARGYFEEPAIEEVNRKIDELLALTGANIDAYHYCPHHPEGTVSEFAIACACRKPNPAMLLDAAGDWDISLTDSFLIGDKMSDVGAAEAAGVSAILVRTGHGKDHCTAAEQNGTPVFAHVGDAVEYIIAQQ